MKPYIGITGFMSRGEVLSALDNFPEDSDRKLMVGVLTTYKSLRGIPMKRKWQMQTPAPASISELFIDDERAINLVHFSTEQGKESSIFADMQEVQKIAGPNFHGFQLNLVWPEIWTIRRYRDAYGFDEKIILQIGKEAVEKAGDTIQGVVSRVYKYVDLIDGILLDPSGGQGKPFDTMQAKKYLSVITNEGWDLDLGVAGGLGPNTLGLVESLVDEFPNLNIDAQGALRNKKHELDINSVQAYISRALTLFNRNP